MGRGYGAIVIRFLRPEEVAIFTSPVAVHLLLVKDGRVLLLRRYNTGYEDGNYSVVAGHIDGGEQLKTAMVREAREEVGIEISPSNLKVVGVMHSFTDKEYVHFFLQTSEWSGEVVNVEPHECDDLCWSDIDALPDNTIPYIRSAVENYRTGVWFDSFGWT